MTDTSIEWPREIWAQPRGEFEHEGVHVYHLASTVPRWEGDREGPFQKYIDADIYDSAEKYHAERYAALSAENEALRAAQSHTYIGKDGKPVLARDMEDELVALRAQVATAYVTIDMLLDQYKSARNDALREAADWHMEVAQHDQGGMEYSAAVGIPISNWKELDLSVRTHEWCAREILSLITDTPSTGEGG